jgi:murein DD-endopeptidase MepM/ murein hydrolase activator NlpD
MRSLPNATQLCALWLCSFTFGAMLVALSLPTEIPLPTNKTPNFFGVQPAPRAVLLPRAKELAEVKLSPAKASKVIAAKKPESIITPQDIEALLSLAPIMPLEKLDPLGLQESFRSPRSGGRKHHALDLTAPRGTPIRAITDGTIARKFSDDLGGTCLYQKTPAGDFMFFYAHLSRYAKNVKLGQAVKKGDIIGYTGDSGNAKGHPHLHFGIAKLLTTDSLWSQVLVNPYYIFTAKPYPFPKKRH